MFRIRKQVLTTALQESTIIHIFLSFNLKQNMGKLIYI